MIINPTFPAADDVCTRIRGAWDLLRLVDDLPQIHVSHLTEVALRETLETNARRAVVVKAADAQLVLVTPIEVQWIVTPRRGDGEDRLMPDYSRAIRFDPDNDTVQHDWPDATSAHCHAYAFGLPEDALKATGTTVAG